MVLLLDRVNTDTIRLVRHRYAIPTHVRADLHTRSGSSRGSTWGVCAYPARLWRLKRQFHTFGPHLGLLGGQVGGLAQDWFGLGV